MTINELNKDLRSVSEALAQQASFRKRLDQQLDLRETLLLEHESLVQQLKKEEKDVEQLEKMTIVRLFHTLKNDTVEKLDEEMQDVLNVKSKIDRMNAEIESLDNKIRNLRNDIDDTAELKQKYQAILGEKKSLIEREHPGVWSDYLNFEDKKQSGINQLKELEEAQKAGEHCLYMVSDVKKSLKSAANWGTYDMLGGGMLATMAKHGHMEEAQNRIHQLSSSLRVFNKELSDVGKNITNEIQLDGFMSFADYFFDGLFVDWAVQSQIEKAQNQIYQLERKIENLLSQLKNSYRNEQNRIDEINQQQNNLIVNL